MRCFHNGKTKQKLVSVAYSYKGKQYQYFTMKPCCARCGCVVKAK